MSTQGSGVHHRVTSAGRCSYHIYILLWWHGYICTYSSLVSVPCSHATNVTFTLCCFNQDVRIKMFWTIKYKYNNIKLDLFTDYSMHGFCLLKGHYHLTFTSWQRDWINFILVRKALSRAHKSSKVQRSPSIQSSRTKLHTHRYQFPQCAWEIGENVKKRTHKNWTTYFFVIISFFYFFLVFHSVVLAKSCWQTNKPTNWRTEMKTAKAIYLIIPEII